jgi:hypothetical protein
MYSLVSGLSQTICRNYWGARPRPERVAVMRKTRQRDPPRALEIMRRA